MYTVKNKIKDRIRPYWHLLKRALDHIFLRFARGVLRLFPSVGFKRENLYPPKELWHSSKQWTRNYGNKIGAEFIAVDSACTVFHVQPKTVHQSVRRQLTMDLEYEYQETFILKIPNGRMWGSGYIITPDDRLLDDVSIDFRAARYSMYPKASSVARYWKCESIVELDGRAAVLSTDAADIFYHWFFQLLPRFELLRQGGIDIDGIDYFIVNDLSKAFQQDFIRALGLDFAKIIELSKIRYLRARELIVPSIPLGGGCYRPWMLEFLRDTFLDGYVERGTGRRVYISRGLASYRRIHNEDDVIQLLLQYGFQQLSMEGLSMQEQAQAMASCEAVVAPHGAGLSNIVYCRRGTKIIEIYSPELVTGFFWKLASQLSLDYYYCLGKGSPESHEDNYFQSWDARADITVDLVTLRKTLELASLAQPREGSTA